MTDSEKAKFAKRSIGQHVGKVTKATKDVTDFIEAANDALAGPGWLNEVGQKAAVILGDELTRVTKRTQEKWEALVDKDDLEFEEPDTFDLLDEKVTKAADEAVTARMALFDLMSKQPLPDQNAQQQTVATQPVQPRQRSKPKKDQTYKPQPLSSEANLGELND